jgi:hypothetical protein
MIRPCQSAMAYLIYCKYPARPPADGSSTAKGSADTGFGLTLRFALCSSSLDPRFDALLQVGTAVAHGLLQPLMSLHLPLNNTITNTYGVVLIEYSHHNTHTVKYLSESRNARISTNLLKIAVVININQSFDCALKYAV